MVHVNEWKPVPERCVVYSRLIHNEDNEGMIIVIFVLIIASLCLSLSLRFFGEEMTVEEWKKRIHDVSALTSDGSWHSSWDLSHFRPLYSTNCHAIDRYKYGTCTNSNGNTGTFFSWVPKNRSSYHHFNPKDFCELMQGRNILFVGDSLTEQFMLSLISGLLAHPIPGKRGVQQNDVDQIYSRCKEYPCTMHHASCENNWRIDCGAEMESFKVAFKFTKHLNLNEEGTSNDNINWVEKIWLYNSSLVVLNTGAHHHDHALLHLEKGLEIALERYGHNVSFVYRNSVPGHANCSDYFDKHPLVKPQNLSNYKPDSFYNWNRFEPFNEAAKKILNLKFQQVLYLDIAASGKLRADSHPGIMDNGRGVIVTDCLHYCQPGPTDNWVQIFYDALLLVLNRRPPPFEGHADEHLHPSLITLRPENFKGGPLLVRHNKLSSKWIFLIENSTKHAIPSLEAFVAVAEGKEFADVERVNSISLLDFPSGAPIHLENTGKRIKYEYK